MADVQVTCISMPDSQGSHEDITHLGNPAGGWKWTREKVIANIDAYANTFYVTDSESGERLVVGVVRIAGKAPYLRTRANGKWNDVLLSLGRCP